jgi:phosphoribosylformylglycinamidine synthase
MNLAIVRFPGSNCDDDVAHALRHALGDAAYFVGHKEDDLGPGDAVVLPGGFSYGDYLRAGAMAARSPVMAAVRRFAQRGGPVLGICNGYQILCEAGLLDGALTRNASLHFVCRDVFVRVEGRPTPFTAAIPAGRIMRLPIAHAEGRFVHPAVEQVEAEARVVFRYCDSAGGVSPINREARSAAVESREARSAAVEGREARSAAVGDNPNGSAGAIAGTCNAAGNVLGLMPHPERACERILSTFGSADGRMIFESLRQHLQGTLNRTDSLTIS